MKVKQGKSMAKPRPPKPPPPKPARVRGPITNRRKGNRAITPAKGAQFLERKPPKLRRVAVDDPGPEDLTEFDT